MADRVEPYNSLSAECLVAQSLILLRVGRVSVATRCCLLGSIEMSVSVWLPTSSRLSACYCLDRHCVLKSLVVLDR